MCTLIIHYSTGQADRGPQHALITHMWRQQFTEHFGVQRHQGCVGRVLLTNKVRRERQQPLLNLASAFHSPLVDQLAVIHPHVLQWLTGLGLI